MKRTMTKSVVFMLITLSIGMVAFEIDAQSVTPESRPEVKAFDRPVISGNTVQLYSKSNRIVATLPIQTQLDIIYDWSTQYLLYTIATEDGFPEGVLRIYNIQSEKSKALTGYNIASAALSPDEQSIAVITYQPNSLALYVFDIQDLTPRKLVDENVKPYSVEWSPNGDKLVYVIETIPPDPETDIEFVTDVEYIEFSSGKKERISNTGLSTSPRWLSEQTILFKDAGISKSYSLSTKTITDSDPQIWKTLAEKKFMPALSEKPYFYCPYTAGEPWYVTQGFWNDPSSTCKECCKQSYSDPNKYICTAKGTDMTTYTKDKRPYATTCSSHCIGNRYGIDFWRSDAYGRDVRASAKGEVTIAKYSSSAGNYVTIKHLGTGYTSRYLHNSKLFVKVGDNVERGEKIAECGNSGAGGTHIHFDVNLGGDPKPPEPLDICDECPESSYTSKTTPGIRTGQWLKSHNDDNPSSYTLKVTTTGIGTGTVTGSGIRCGADCTQQYDAGTRVTLTAEPEANSVFVGWGGACSGTGDCVVTMNADRSVTAEFAIAGEPTFAVFNSRLYQAARRFSDGAVVTRYTRDGNSWRVWEANGYTDGNVSMAVFNGKLYQAVRGVVDDGVFTRFYTPGVGWSSWEENGHTKGNINMVVFDEKLYQAVRGVSNDGVFTRYYTPGSGWSSWEENGHTKGNVSMAVFDGKLYQAVRGVSNDGVFTRYYTPGSGWSSWEENGHTKGNVSMTVFDGKLYQAVKGVSNDGVFTRYYTPGSGWSSWEENGYTKGNVSMAVFDGKLYQAVRGVTDNGVFTRYYTPGIGWSSWEKNGYTSSDISMEVFYNRFYQTVRGKASVNNIFTRYLTVEKGWTAWIKDGDTGLGQRIETIPATGGSVALPDGAASVTFPVGAASHDLSVSIEEHYGEMSPPANAGFVLVGNVYEFIATNAAGEEVSQFAADLEISLQYDPDALDGIAADSLRIKYYDEDQAIWIELPSTVDTDQHTVTATTNHFTKFAIFGVDSTTSTYLRDDWNDIDKSLSNPDDDWMCWAAAAANILDWAGWSTPLFDSAQDMFYAFQEYWTNAGGLMQYGWQWWFDGTEPPDLTGWAQLNEGWSQAEEGGSYWSEYNFFDYFSEDWALWDSVSGLWSDGSYLMAAIDEYLHDEYGVTLAIYSDSGGHALTAWGYAYDEWGNYTGVYVTDSDDYMSDLKLLPVSLVDDLWYLDTANEYGYSGWFIGGVQALDQRDPIPEPGTLILIVLGLLGLRVLVRKRIKHRK